MTCLEMCILTLVIGFTVILMAYAIIQKIFEENRKNSDRGIKMVNEFFSKASGIMLETYDGIQKREEERKKKERAERKKDYTKMTDEELMPWNKQ